MSAIRRADILAAATEYGERPFRTFDLAEVVIKDRLMTMQQDQVVTFAIQQVQNRISDILRASGLWIPITRDMKRLFVIRTAATDDEIEAHAATLERGGTSLIETAKELRTYIKERAQANGSRHRPRAGRSLVPVTA